MQSSRVAVVIPVYNGARYLAETLRSVLAQTRPASEILVIDDGSTDTSLKIAASFGPRVRTISRSNRGISVTRNFGASEIQAEWITFLDQDDLLEPESLARRAAALAADPTADVCYTGRRDLFSVNQGQNFFLSGPICIPPPEQLRAELLRRCLFNPGCATIRRSTFLALGGFDPELDGVEDWDLWIRLLQAGARFIHVAEPLMQYRIHANSATQNAPRILNRSLRLLEKSIFPQLSLPDRWGMGRRTKNRLYAEAAIVMREGNNVAAYRTMLRSITAAPFGNRRRYVILLHMLLFGLRPRSSGARQLFRLLRTQSGATTLRTSLVHRTKPGS